MTSKRVLCLSSRRSASGELCGSSSPAIDARRSTDSGNESPSVWTRKSKILPFLPEEKSNHACFWSLTVNDGVFSCWNGDSPFHSRPARFSFTRLPTTSETGSRARSSSRNWGVKRIEAANFLSTGHQYRRGRTQAIAQAVVPVRPQGTEAEFHVKL